MTEETLTPEEVVDTTATTDAQTTADEAQTQEQTTEAVIPLPAAEPAKPKKTLDDRLKEISKKTWELRETERRIQSEREQLEKLREQAGKTSPPNEDDFDDVDKFRAAKAAHEAQQIESRARALADQRLQEQGHQQHVSQVMSKWEYAKEVAIEKDPQWLVHEAKVERALTAYNRLGYSQAILTSEKGADIVSYFGKNPDHLDRFVQLTPEQAIKEIGILEYKLTQKPVKKTSPPPDPISPVSGAGGAARDLGKMSFSDFEAFRNKQERGLK